MVTVQRQFEGFLNTPVLWNESRISNLPQFEIEQKSLSFDVKINREQPLGKLVEGFVFYQFSKNDGITIIEKNIQILKDKITLGELDCLLFKNGIPIHLEIAYKFYLFDCSSSKKRLQRWIGSNKKDNLIKKLDQLQKKQLPLLYSKPCSEYLKSINLCPEIVSQQVYFKAQLFVPFGMKRTIKTNLNLDCIAGFYLSSKDLFQLKDGKFYIPKKRDWLIIPHNRVNWMDYESFYSVSKSYLERRFSPMCWIKTEKGMLRKFFLIWWKL